MHKNSDMEFYMKLKKGAEAPFVNILFTMGGSTIGKAKAKPALTVL